MKFRCRIRVPHAANAKKAQDYDAAFIWCKRLIRNNPKLKFWMNSLALAFWAGCYEGTEIPTNKAKAIEMLEYSANHLYSSKAYGFLSMCYFYGDFVERDPKKARELLAQAVRIGLEPEMQATATEDLGHQYAGVDPIESFNYFHSAFRLGRESAGYHLGMCYEFGRGTRQDLNKAKYFYTRMGILNPSQATKELLDRIDRKLSGQNHEVTDQVVASIEKRNTYNRSNVSHRSMVSAENQRAALTFQF